MFRKNSSFSIRNVKLETRILSLENHTQQWELLLNPFVLRPLSRLIFAAHADESVGRQLSSEREAIIVCNDTPLKRTCNCTKVVPVQKTGPPALRNAKTRKSTASGKKKRLHHACTSNVQRACISPRARPEIFLILSFHAADPRRTILRIILADDNESGIFDTDRASLVSSDMA